jgi:hypothetical protein
MRTFLHDIDLGPKPDAHNQHRVLSNGRSSELLLTILHYLRDESADCLGRSTDAMRNGQSETATMELGGHELLVQAFTKINDLRNTPLEIEATD